MNAKNMYLVNFFIMCLHYFDSSLLNFSILWTQFKQKQDEFFLLLQSAPYDISATGEQQKPLQRHEASNVSGVEEGRHL